MANYEVVKQEVEDKCKAYLKKHPRPSIAHDQQQIVRYCLNLLSVLDAKDPLFCSKLLIVLADVNKKLRQKHNKRISTLLFKIIYLGMVTPLDSGIIKLTIEDALCSLMGLLLLSHRINYSLQCQEVLLINPINFRSVKRGDIVARCKRSVIEQQADIVEITNEALFTQYSKKGLLALTLYKRKTTSKKTWLSKDVINNILMYINKAMPIEEAERVLNHVREFKIDGRVPAKGNQL